MEHWPKIGKWNEVEYKNVVLILIDSKILYHVKYGMLVSNA